jgi:hypothetical protein
MSPTLEEKRRDERERARQEQEAGLLEAASGDGVLSALGRPGGLLRARVKCPRAGSFRVNVFVGEADGDRKLLTCTPALTRAY